MILLIRLMKNPRSPEDLCVDTEFMTCTFKDELIWDNQFV